MSILKQAQRAIAQLLLLLISLCSHVQAQDTGQVTGVVVSSWDAANLSGVAITVRGTTLAAQTDQQGRYEVKNVPVGDQILRFSKSGFATTTVTDVRVIVSQTTTVNGSLRPEFFDMETYEVTAEEFSEQAEKLLFDRQQASSMLEAIGSEQFSRLGSGDAGAIVARVTGVSLVGGKYAVVRGLSDRYTRTLMNGLEVPSSDPYRSSPQLDLFPSSMIDRINVNKSFTPDQPGASGGGTIDIITKPFPETAFVKGSVGMSYNSHSNLRDDFLADPKSSTSMFLSSDAPRELESRLWNLNDATRPDPGAIGNSSSKETQLRATDRLTKADAVSGLLQDLGLADFGGVEKSSPVNSSLNVSAGNTVEFFKRKLGLFAGMNYARTFRHLGAFETARYSADTEKRRGLETRSNIGTDLGANANMGYHLSDNAEIGLNFMLAQSIDEEARRNTWTSGEQITDGDRQEQWQLHYTSRQIQNFQLHGDHSLPDLADSKFNWNISTATTSQNEPDHRFIDYTVQADGTPQFGANNLIIPYPSRYFRDINDRSLNMRADWTIPIHFFKEDSTFKFGMWHSTTERKFREQYFRYDLVDGFDPSNPNTYLNDPAYLEYTRSALTPPKTALGVERYNYDFTRYVRTINGNPYSAAQDVTAGYPMVDLGVLSWLRLIGGVRFEKTVMEINPRDRASSGLNQIDLLPSLGAVVALNTNLSVRLGYSGTIARPSFREKADFERNYLPDLGLFAAGNPHLEMSTVESYDARVEWYPAPGDILSAGVFLKQLTKPIELYAYSFDDSLTFINRDAATVRGVEFETRKNLGFLSDSLQGFTLGANVALIQSETEIFPNEFYYKTNVLGGTSRPLYDQSPYIINLDLGYDHPSWGTSLTLAANFTGERIILTTAQGADIYEHVPISFDALMSQKIGKHFVLRLGVRNILDPEFRQTYGNDFDDYLRQTFRRGRTFSFSLGADY